MMDEVYYTQLKQYFTETSKLIRPIPKSSDLLQAVEGSEVPDSLGGTGTPQVELSESYLTTSGREQVFEEAADRGRILMKID
jgi:hypothetical protein